MLATAERSWLVIFVSEDGADAWIRGCVARVGMKASGVAIDTYYIHTAYGNVGS
jgi:hypothetical protein